MFTENYTIITCPAIHTMDEQLPSAEAICVCGDKIAAVGSLKEIYSFVSGSPYKEINLDHGALLPGFIDSHSHLSMFAQCCEQFFCDTHYGTIEALLQAFQQFATQKKDEAWVIGYCYDDTGMQDGRHLTRHDLDAVCADRPVFVSHITSHMGYANTLALKLLNITAATKVQGGVVVLGKDGEPEGLLKENAYFQAFQSIPACPPEKLPEMIEHAIALYNKEGFTMFQDGGIGFSSGAHAVLRAYNQLAREGRMTARGYLHFLPSLMDELLELGVWNMSVSDYLYYGGVKCFADGSIQSLTAVLGSPYSCSPDFYGDYVQTPEQIAALISHYHSLGVPVAFHANGDLAIEFVIKGFEKALDGKLNTVKGDMIIHVQMASDEQLARIHACGVTPTFFVRHVHVWGERHVNIFIGEERASRLDPCGSCVRMGIPFSLHVDSPVQPVNALHSIHTAVNRTTTTGRVLGPDQRVSTLEALKAYTVYAAKCSGRDHIVGRIAPGYYADFVQLSEDPLAMAPERLDQLSVVATICGGRIVYQA